MTALDGPASAEASDTVIHADTEDAGVLSQVIADAFHDLAPSRWLIPDEASRRQVFPDYFRLFVEYALASGVVHTNPARTAAALWLPVAENGPDQSAGYGERLAAATSPWTYRFRAFDAVLDRHHPVGVAHHHLALLAVRPDVQGQGIGTALLRAYHARLDHDLGLSAYLEAVDERTHRIYLAHGYADHGPALRLPGGPAMHPMWRWPRRHG